MPTPRKGEKRDDYMKRCIPATIRDGKAKDGKQGYAICSSLWMRAHSDDSGGDAMSLVFVGMSDPAQVRMATFSGRSHVVVPVVAMVGGTVVRPHASKGPELVVPEFLAYAPAGWNGVPVMPNHPMIDGRAVTANSPDVLDTQCFGRVFNAEFSDGKLHVEAWLDVERANAIGGVAADIVSRVMSHEMVEVSIGCYIQLAEEEGVTESGERYAYRWAGPPIPDHLAMLPAGTRGACSIDKGCGAPRVMSDVEDMVDKSPGDATTMYTNNSSSIPTPDSSKLNAPPATHVVDIPGSQDSPTTPATPPGTAVATDTHDIGDPMNQEPTRSTWRRVMSVLSNLITLGPDAEGTAEPSDSDIRTKLHSALRAVEPGYDGIVEVFPSTNTVVYACAPEREYVYYRRTFSMSEGGDVTLADDRQRVRPKMGYEVVPDDTEPNNMSSHVHSATCGCPGGAAATTLAPDNGTTPAIVAASDADDTGAATTGGNMSMTKKELVGRLVSHKAAVFTENDRAMLEALCETRLTALATALDASTAEPAPVKPAAMSEEEWLKAAPARVRDIVAHAEKIEADTRTALISALVKAQTTLSEDQLKARTTDDLQAFADMLDVGAPPVSAGYMARPMPVPDATPTAPVRPYDKALEARRKSA